MGVELPDWRDEAAEGDRRVASLTVNDGMALAAWTHENGTTGKASMVSAGLCEFTRAVGLEQDLSERGLDMRSKSTATAGQIEGSDGAIREAHRRYEADPEKYFMPDQYNNPANWQAHYDTTGPEIIRQTQGRITHFIAGVGTSGTLIGTGHRLREFNPDVEIAALLPAEDLHGIEGLKHLETAIVPGIWDERFPDLKLSVHTEEAYDMARRLALEEGLLVGQSAGAAVHAALDLARRIADGGIVTILPDAGDRYCQHPALGELMPHAEGLHA